MLPESRFAHDAPFVTGGHFIHDAGTTGSPGRLHTYVTGARRAHAESHRAIGISACQLRRLSSARAVTSGSSVALRGFSRLIYFIARYIIHNDFNAARPPSAPDTVSKIFWQNVEVAAGRAAGQGECVSGALFLGSALVLFVCLTK